MPFDAGPCLPPGSSSDIQRAAPRSFYTGSSHTGSQTLGGWLCFYPEGTWLEGEPQNAMESSVESAC